MNLSQKPDGSPRGDQARRIAIQNVTRDTWLATAAEVADRGATRRKGLLGRAGLSEGEGLWIVPCESVHTVAMKFSIDLVYLDRKKRVRKVRSRVPPWRISACLLAHSVLELPAGTVVRTLTVPGDQILVWPAEEPGIASELETFR